MKNTFYFGVILMLSFSLMSSTCSNDDDFNNPNDNSQQITEVIITASNGSWVITSFIDSGQNETNDFDGYQFTFNADGNLTADNGSTSINGNWSVTNSNSNDDSSSSSDIDFNIFFQVLDTSVFEDLNDDWDIVSYTGTTISLIDVSGGNGGTNTLVFEKIN